MISFAIVLFLLPTLGYVVLRSSAVQSYLSQKIAAYFSKKHNVEIRIGGVDIALFNKVIFEDLYIEDVQADTMIFVKEFNAAISNFSYRKSEIEVSKILLDGTKIRFAEDSTGKLNLDYFLEAFVSDEETQESGESLWQFSTQSFELRDASFAYRKFRPDTVEHGINFSDLMLEKMNLLVSEFSLGDTMRFAIDKFSFREKSGFVLDSLSGETAFSDTHLGIERFRLSLGQSDLLASHVIFKFDSISDFSDFTNKVYLDIKFSDTARIVSSDVAGALGSLRGIDRRVALGGSIKGTVSDLTGEKFILKYGENTILDADFYVKGLPNIDSTFFDCNIRQLKVSNYDLTHIPVPPFPEKNYLKLPSQVRKMGFINFKGVFKGTLDNFTTQNTLICDLGEVSTDLTLRPDTANNYHNFEGSIDGRNLNLAVLAGQPKMLGKGNMKFDFSGKKKPNNKFDAQMEGELTRVDLNGYNYEKIAIDGNYIREKFTGKIDINDQNLELAFNGSFDLSQKVPKLNFNLSVPKAKLEELNLAQERPGSMLSFKMIADFQGDTPDNMLGKIRLADIAYAEDSIGKINFTDFVLAANELDEDRQIELRSEYIDFEIKGQYQFESLAKSFVEIAEKYVPSIMGKEQIALKKKKEETQKKQRRKNKKRTQGTDDEVKKTEFEFRIALKDTRDFTTILLPSAKFDSTTQVFGNYSSETKKLIATVTSDTIQFGDSKFQHFFVNAVTKDEIFLINMGSERFSFAQGNYLDNFGVISRLYNDTIDLDMHWENWDTLRYSGHIMAQTTFTSKPGDQFPIVNLAFQPSEVVLADTTWHIQPGRLSLDTTAIEIENSICIRNDIQSLNISGKMTENKTDSLFLKYEKINLANLNPVLESQGLALEGELSGETSLKDLYKNIKINTENIIAGFKLNDEPLGDITMQSFWDDKTQSASLDLKVSQGVRPTLDLTGTYSPEGGKLDFDTKLNRMNLYILRPYLKDNISNLVGQVDGVLKIHGTTEKPLLDGKLYFYKNGFVLNYTKVRYSLSDTVYLKEDAIVFKQMRINAAPRSYATLSGKIKHKYFSDFELDLLLDAKNFNFIDTEAKDNETFYGTAYASGQIEIKGKPEKLEINANMETRPRTRLFVPLTTAGEVSEDDFLTFVSPDTAQTQDEEEYEADLSGMLMNFNLSVTPDAQIQLVFDEKVGDIIKARGEGDLRMTINTLGDFEMVGEYAITKGDYLFTLQNIVNKRFDIKPGGTILWSGDPMNARIDLEAIYHVNKVSLYDLVLDEEYKDTRVNVDCQLKLGNKLTNPELEFGIKLPDADEKVGNRINNLPEDDLNKQVLSLLIINRFQPLTGLASASIGAQDMGMSTSEMLSNQLSNWLSQISNDFDIGVKYRPGDAISNDQVEVALSTQLWNDRVTINGNVGVGGGVENSGTSNNMVGDFDVDVKITKSGKLRVKAYTKANDNTIYETGPYTNGVGIFYREEFNSLRELFSQNTDKKKRKNKENKQQEDQKNLEKREEDQ